MSLRDSSSDNPSEPEQPFTRLLVELIVRRGDPDSDKASISVEIIPGKDFVVGRAPRSFACTSSSVSKPANENPFVAPVRAETPTDFVTATSNFLNISNPIVSRSHMAFYLSPDDKGNATPQLYIKDLESKHGTYINEDGLSVTTTAVKPGDIIRLGQTTVRHGAMHHSPAIEIRNYHFPDGSGSTFRRCSIDVPNHVLAPSPLKTLFCSSSWSRASGSESSGPKTIARPACNPDSLPSVSIAKRLPGFSCDPTYRPLHHTGYALEDHVASKSDKEVLPIELVETERSPCKPANQDSFSSILQSKLKSKEVLEWQNASPQPHYHLSSSGHPGLDNIEESMDKNKFGGNNHMQDENRDINGRRTVQLDGDKSESDKCQDDDYDSDFSDYEDWFLGDGFETFMDDDELAHDAGFSKSVQSIDRAGLDTKTRGHSTPFHEEMDTFSLEGVHLSSSSKGQHLGYNSSVIKDSSEDNAKADTSSPNGGVTRRGVDQIRKIDTDPKIETCSKLFSPVLPPRRLVDDPSVSFSARELLSSHVSDASRGSSVASSASFPLSPTAFSFAPRYSVRSGSPLAGSSPSFTPPSPSRGFELDNPERPPSLKRSRSLMERDTAEVSVAVPRVESRAVENDRLSSQSDANAETTVNPGDEGLGGDESLSFTLVPDDDKLSGCGLVVASEKTFPAVPALAEAKLGSSSDIEFVSDSIAERPSGATALFPSTNSAIPSASGTSPSTAEIGAVSGVSVEPAQKRIRLGAGAWTETVAGARPGSGVMREKKRKHWSMAPGWGRYIGQAVVPALAGIMIGSLGTLFGLAAMPEYGELADFV